MSGNKLIILDEKGRVPTDQTTRQIISAVAKATGKDGRFDTFAGRKYNNPKVLQGEIDKRTIIVSINGMRTKCVLGRRNLYRFKRALKSNSKTMSSWEIVERDE